MKDLYLSLWKSIQWISHNSVVDLEVGVGVCTTSKYLQRICFWSLQWSKRCSSFQQKGKWKHWSKGLGVINYFLFFNLLKVIGVLHYLWSADLSKTFFQFVMSIFIFSQYLFQWILPGGNVWGYPTLLILWLINFKLFSLISNGETLLKNVRETSL